MYEVIDNFLPESEFKEIKEWANAQPFPSQQDWSPYLTEGENVSIKKPSVGRDIHFFQENKMDDSQEKVNLKKFHVSAYWQNKILSWKKKYPIVNKSPDDLTVFSARV